MNLWWIKKKMAAPAISFEPGDVYLISDEMQSAIIKNLIPKGLLKHFEILDINQTLEQYRDGDKHNVLIIRSGGVGDILALSSLLDTLEGKEIYFATQKYFEPVFKWYGKPVTFKDYSVPLFSGWNMFSPKQIKKVLRRFYCEGIIEEGSSDNWYEVFFRQIGIEPMEAKHGRPNMKTDRIISKDQAPSHIDETRNSILVCHKATSQMRSMSFEDLYHPIVLCLDEAKDREANIYVHKDVLTGEDLSFIDEVKDERIRIIQAANLEEYLLDLYDATITVSVDTAAIHFREGIEKPGLGVYGAFTTNSRTKYYKHTYSFNVTSHCELQPCFMHEKTKGQVCPKASEGDIIAPCLSSRQNDTLRSQLYENMRTDLIKNL